MDEPDFLARTRRSYDAAAENCAEWIAPEVGGQPLDRALLSGFAELVRTAGARPVADIGCGPGGITEHLAGLGLQVLGIDLSPGMVAAARDRHPGLRFDEGSMTDLDLADGELGGIVAWYSTIRVPEAELPAAFAEFARALAPGGYLQLAFQTGTGTARYDAFGEHAVSLDFHRREPDDLVALLEPAGLRTCARTVREPDSAGAFPEPTPQGYLLAREPGG